MARAREDEMKNAGSTWVAMIVGMIGLLGASMATDARANPAAPAAKAKPAAHKTPKAAKAKKPPAAADHCAIDDLGFGTMLAKKSDVPPPPVKTGKPVDTIAQSKAAADKFDLGRKSRNADRPTDGNEVKMQSKTLSLAVVAGVVSDRQSDLEYCLMQLPEKERGSEEFTLHLTIAPNGTVVDAKATGDQIAEKIDACVQSQAKRWTFPQADAPTEIDYPLAFHISN
jgi:hypothetical protein